MVATPPDTPASTVKTEPILPAVATLGYAGLPYLGRKRHNADANASLLLANNAPNALPVVTIPEPATTGYAVGASGAIRGQAPVAAMKPAAVATPAIAAAPLGYSAALLGYALSAPAVTVAAPAVAAPAVLGYAGHPLVYGKSPPNTGNEGL